MSQELPAPSFQRRRTRNEILGNPLLNEEFRSELRLRCMTNHWPKVHIRHSCFFRGSGLFASEPIRQNEWVCEYAGKLVTKKEYDMLLSQLDDEAKRQEVAAYALGGGSYTIMSHPEIVAGSEHLVNSFGRRVNHSRLHANLKAPQWVNLAPNGSKPDYHALMQVNLCETVNNYCFIFIRKV